MGNLEIQWLGQATFLYRFPTGITVCTDPYLSYGAGGGKTRPRMLPVLVPPSQLDADVVAITHDHSDHFDENALRGIAERPGTVFVGPASCREHWLALELPGERFLRLDQGESLEIDDLRLTATHAAHSSGSRRDAIGVVLVAGERTVYHVGDSEYTEQLVENVSGLAPDLMVVPINGRGGNMDHEQAAQLAQVVRPRAAIPMHYGMFQNNTADPQTFVDACRALQLAARIVIALPGKWFTLASEGSV